MSTELGIFGINTPEKLKSLTFPCTVYEVYGTEYDYDDNISRWAVGEVQAVSAHTGSFTIEGVRAKSSRRTHINARYLHKSEQDARASIAVYKERYNPPKESLADVWRMLISESEDNLELDYVASIVRKAKELLPPED